MVLRRVLGHIAKWRGVFEIAVNCFWVLWEGRWIDEDLPESVDHDVRTIVMTVAQGEGFHAAQRFSRKHGLPLVVFFHDWWPDMASVPALFRRFLEKSFLLLAKECSLGLCVSDGMRKALGLGENLKNLSPISAGNDSVDVASRVERSSSLPFRIFYSGTLGEYGPMLGVALKESLNHPEIQFQVRGANPNWTDDFKHEMRTNGQWLQFAPRRELMEWLASAHAFLIPMVFEPEMRRRMETSFPSKLIEFVQFGKPLIIWGPEYCSAVKWARKDNCALCVTDPDPKVLLRELEKLTSSQKEYQRLSSAAREAAETDFSHDRIQAQFMEALRGIPGMTI
jgi:glycosyltransferase involved in cell wall biosynthesis